MKTFLSILALVALVLVVWHFVLPLIGFLLNVIVTAVIVVIAIAVFFHIKNGGNKT